MTQLFTIFVVKYIDVPMKMKHGFTIASPVIILSQIEYIHANNKKTVKQ